MTADERAELERWVAESRARQGLGPRITDQETLSRFVAMVAATLSQPAKGGDRGRGAA